MFPTLYDIITTTASTPQQKQKKRKLQKDDDDDDYGGEEKKREEVEPEKKTKEVTRGGTCHQYAYRIMQAQDLLIQGYISNEIIPGLCILHSWVIRKSVVGKEGKKEKWEVIVLDKLGEEERQTSFELYAGGEKVRYPLRMFTQKEVMEKAMKYGTYGPWYEDIQQGYVEGTVLPLPVLEGVRSGTDEYPPKEIPSKFKLSRPLSDQEILRKLKQIQ